MPVRKYQPYEFEEEETQTALYQDYVPETTSVASLKEVLFFVNIACFASFQPCLALSFSPQVQHSSGFQSSNCLEFASSKVPTFYD